MADTPEAKPQVAITCIDQAASVTAVPFESVDERGEGVFPPACAVCLAKGEITVGQPPRRGTCGIMKVPDGHSELIFDAGLPITQDVIVEFAKFMSCEITNVQNLPLS